MKRCFALRQRWLFTKTTAVVLITLIGTDGKHNPIINGYSTKINNAEIFMVPTPMTVPKPTSLANAGLF